jgi:hypothetical protein
MRGEILAVPRGIWLPPLPPIRSAADVRSSHHRKGARTERFRGETVAVELRDARLISAALRDESAAGLGIYVADGTLFRPTQAVAVWRRGQRHRAIVQYVTGAGEVARLGIKLFPV